MNDNSTCANPRVAFVFLYTFNGKANATPLERGSTTVSNVERHMVVEVRLEDLFFDVGLRMCTVRELARFQTFPDSYQFTGKKEDMQRHIGNAVPPDAAYVFVKAALSRKGMVRSRLSDFDSPGSPVIPMEVLA